MSEVAWALDSGKILYESHAKSTFWASTTKTKYMKCLACGQSTLNIRVREAVLGYCPQCQLTYMYEYTPDKYVCEKCSSNLKLIECYVVRARCSECGVQASFVSNADDWNILWDIAFDIYMKRITPYNNDNFLVSIGEPLVVKKPPSPKKYKLHEQVIIRLREIMKSKWQDPEYRRKVVEGERRAWEVKKAVTSRSL